MELFETTLLLLLGAVLLLQASRRFHVPYPTMLAVAGAGVAALPWSPGFAMEPHLALALFITPALLDSAYDLPPRQLRRDWLPLTALALVAVVVTTAAVAWAGHRWIGLPVAAAITLGAIVAPPDAAAASAVLRRFHLPRRTLALLEGESLLNDASSLLIYGAAVSATVAQAATLWWRVPLLVIAIPGGIAVGLLLARLYLEVRPWVAGTLTGTIFEFVSTFGVWVIAERIHVSPILAIVAYAMKLAHHIPERQSPRDRVHSYSVWETVVFVLNVLAFLIMGLQARAILTRLRGDGLGPSLMFAFQILGLVLLVRMVWVVAFCLVAPWLMTLRRRGAKAEPGPSMVPTWREGVLISWCGMRGMVTLAASFALPERFPGRDTIVLTAFLVVLGTLLIQGLTVNLVIRLLRIAPDLSLDEEISSARTRMIRAAIESLDTTPGAAASAVRAEYEAAQAEARGAEDPQSETEHDRLRMNAIAEQRRVLARLRRQGEIGDDTFHRLEEELDWSELNAGPHGHFQIQDV